MPVLSIFCDEACQQDMSDGLYPLTVVAHEQSAPIGAAVADYEHKVARHGLPDVPFHMKELLHGHGDYEGLPAQVRKGLLDRFNELVRRLPVTYRAFAYTSYDTTAENLSRRMRRDLVNFAYDHLAWFQSFGRVPVYYDNGQAAVTDALHRAFDLILDGQAIDYRRISYRDYRLAQAADYLCSVELAARRYGVGEASRTYVKFYGMAGSFRRNYLKPARRKLMA